MSKQRFYSPLEPQRWVQKLGGNARYRRRVAARLTELQTRSANSIDNGIDMVSAHLEFLDKLSSESQDRNYRVEFLTFYMQRYRRRLRRR